MTRVLICLCIMSTILVSCLLLQSPDAHADDPKTWKEPMTGMEFVWIPPGCFDMGSSPSEPGHDPDEEPVHEVCLNGFWLGKKEVTVREFGLFARTGAYVTQAEQEGFSWVYDEEWQKRQGASWKAPGFAQDESHPAVHLSHNDAQAMAKWLSRENGRAFRLPTEAEWEYACRAGSRSARYWGDDPGQACASANVADLSSRSKFPAWVVHDCRDGYTFTAPAGSYRPNPFGLYDMLGNVWEWCEDSYDPGAYHRSRRQDQRSQGGDSSRVIRGGSWYSRPEQVRCANRDYVSSLSRRGSDLGFRLILEP